VHSNYNGINVYKNIIEPKFCNTLIDIFKQNRNSSIALDEDYGEGTNVKCRGLMTTTFKSIDEKLFDIIRDILKKAQVDNPHLQCSGDSGYQLREIYGATRLHIDSVLDFNDPTKARTVALIIALNSNYDGGEFNFPFQNFKTKLKQGEVIIFPAAHTHPHEVSSPENGTLRYTINTWLFA
tara:strand:- start:801 stop:1343 length:543 start_codon:yes stop_codon:yes gene_type:complete